MKHLAIASLLFITACAIEESGGAMDETTELSAADDELVVEMSTAAELAVMDNDRGVDDARTIEVATGPEHGEASFDDAGVLHYTPAADYLGVDVVHYSIANPDGSRADAVVAIDVRCATCAIGAPIRLSWLPNAPSDMVLGYRLFLGASEDATSMVMVDEVTVDSPAFDPAMPGATYDAWNDFRLRLGDTACFRLTAYNAAGESDFSNAVCKVVNGATMRFGL
ncbi:MAG: Ig-like domain-containing protein [Kofleriaceae bacterium]